MDKITNIFDAESIQELSKMYNNITKNKIEFEKFLAKKNEVLGKACELGAINIIDDLLDNYDADLDYDDGENICWAASFHQDKVVEHLIKRGASLTLKKSLYLCASAIDDMYIKINQESAKKIITIVHENGGDIHIGDELALHISLMSESFDVAKHLIDLGANVYVDNNSILKDLLKGGWIKPINFLIKQNVDISKIEPSEMANILKVKNIDIFNIYIESIKK